MRENREYEQVRGNFYCNQSITAHQRWALLMVIQNINATNGIKLTLSELAELHPTITDIQVNDGMI